jgi:hypothetical protein
MLCVVLCVVVYDVLAVLRVVLQVTLCVVLRADLYAVKARTILETQPPQSLLPPV